MKPLSALLAIAFLGAPAAFAQTTYTWTEYDNATPQAATVESWTDVAHWDVNGQFVSGASNGLTIFAETSTRLEQEGSMTITDVPAALSLSTLIFNGRGPNNTFGTAITIGDNTSTWTIGDGTTSTVTLNASSGGGGDRYVNYTVPVNLTLNQATTTFTGNGGGLLGLVFSGDIGESAGGYGITKSGSHALIFSGSNTYTGITTVSDGFLRLDGANALPGGIGVAGGTSALTLSGGVLELATGDFLRNVGSGSDQFQITGGNSGFSAVGGPRTVSVNNDPAQELVWGSASFSPSKLVINDTDAKSAPDGNLTLSNKIDLNGSNRTIFVDANTAVLSGDIRTSSGTAGLRKEGGGTLLLTGTSSYNGATTLNGGTLGPAGNLGSGNLVFDGGTLRIDGTSFTTFTGLGSTTINNNRIVGFEISDASHTFTVDTNLTNGSGAVYTRGPGTVVLNGANTFTGQSQVSGGGTLVLDYTTEDNAKISTNRLRVGAGGGKIIFRGGTHTQTVDRLQYDANGHLSFSRDGGSTSTINLNTLGAAAEIRTVSFSEDNLATSDKTNNAFGIIGGYATVGSHFAKNSTNAADGPIIGLEPGDYVAFPASGGNQAVNLQLIGSETLTGTVNGNTLRIENSADDDVLDLANRSLRISNPSGLGGIIYAGGANNNYTITSTTGTIGPENNNQPQHINVFTGTLNIEARVFPGNSTQYDLTKYGEGTLVLTADNIHQGTNNVLQGTLLANNTTGSGTGTGPVLVYAGAKLGGTGTIGGNVTVQKYGGLTFDLSTAPGGHDKLEVDTGKSLAFSSDSILTLTSSGGASTGLYTLLTAAGGITGDAPNFVNLPAGWTADAPQIVGNDLQINITSTGGGDTMPPNWVATWPQADTETTDGFTARGQIDEDGTAYYVVLASGAGAPTSAQVKAGNDSLDAPATASGSIALTASTEGTDAVTGLASGTTFDVYFVAEDGVPNLQASPSLVSVTTLTPSIYDTWAAGFSLTGGDEDPNADTESPTPDGMVQLLEFAFGTNPTVSDNNPLTVTDGTTFTPGQPVVLEIFGGGMPPAKLRYVRRKDRVAAGLTYTPEFHDGTGTFYVDPTPGPTTVVSDAGGDYEVVEVPFPLFDDMGVKAAGLVGRVLVELN